MKKLLALLLASALMAALLASCAPSGNPATGSKEVFVYNWGEYIDQSIFEDFEKETGIHVTYRTYDSNETLYSALSGGGASYDVVIPSDYMIARLADEGKLEPLDFANIPNTADLDPALLNPTYDAENVYSVPYMWGIMGIIYNKTMVNEDVTSWKTLFDPQYAGDLLMINNSRDAFGIALKYLGYSFNTTNEAELREAVDLLVEQKPLVQSYVMDEIFGKLEGGNAAIGTYYYGDYLTMVENNPDLAFCLPEEGANRYVDAMCIPKGAENKANAEAFINFMCSTDVGVKNCEETWYSSPLLSVREQLDPAVSSDSFAYPDAETMAKCEAYSNLPANILALYDSEWLRLKI